MKRLTLIISDGVIKKYFYPAFPPDKNVVEVIAWLAAILILSLDEIAQPPRMRIR